MREDAVDQWLTLIPRMNMTTCTTYCIQRPPLLWLMTQKNHAFAPHKNFHMHS